MAAPALLVLGKRCEYLGPAGYYKIPGGWLKNGGVQGWTAFSNGVTAQASTPELAIRRLLLRAMKVVEAFG